MVKLFGYSFEPAVGSTIDFFEPVRGFLVKDGRRLAEFVGDDVVNADKVKLFVSDADWDKVVADVHSAYLALGNPEIANPVGLLVSDLLVLGINAKNLVGDSGGADNAKIVVYSRDDGFGFVGFGVSLSGQESMYATQILGEFPANNIDVPRVAA